MIIQILERISGKKKELDCGRHCQAVIDAMKRQELLLGKIMEKVTELAGKVQAAADQITANTAVMQKVRVEVETLKNSLANANIEIPAEVQAAFDNLDAAIAASKAATQSIDELIPDAPTEENPVLDPVA